MDKWTWIGELFAACFFSFFTILAGIGSMFVLPFLSFSSWRKRKQEPVQPETNTSVEEPTTLPSRLIVASFKIRDDANAIQLIMEIADIDSREVISESETTFDCRFTSTNLNEVKAILHSYETTLHCNNPKALFEASVVVIDLVTAQTINLNPYYYLPSGLVSLDQKPYNFIRKPNIADLADTGYNVGRQVLRTPVSPTLVSQNLIASGLFDEVENITPSAPGQL